jgi:translation initiation factor 4E
MVTPHSTLATRMEGLHQLSDNWSLWAHLPHDTDWSINSYKKIYTFTTLEETIAITETLPESLVKNCMLFLMRDGIKPIWEDPKNRNGGCFSYKVSNKQVHTVWN